MKIVLDAFGGDNAPGEIVKGACLALNDDKSLELILVGKEDIIKNLIMENNGDMSRIEIVNASEVISMEEVPTTAIRQKRDSSLVKAFETLMQREDVGAIVSAGSTGAVLTGAVLKVGRIKKVSRPAMCPVIPKLTENGGSVALIDCGANAECKPINLCHFAIMGKIYAETYLGIENPRIGLLNIGSESHKGTSLQQETYKLLQQMDINFVGNVEGRNMLEDVCDVIVADGYSGNIALKTCEGALIGLMSMIKRNIKGGDLKTKLGGLLVKGMFKEMKDDIGVYLHKGAAFLGVKKVVIKAHGSSKANTIEASLIQAKQMAESNMIEKIKEGIEKENMDLPEEK